MPLYIRYAALLLTGLACFSAYAHGFDQRYLLPVPVWLYIVSGGVIVVFSFGALALFARGAGAFTYPRFNLLRVRFFRFFRNSIVLVAIRMLSVFVFLAVIVAGIAGTQDSHANIAPTFVWIVWWVGIAFVCAFIGNVWILLNPWKILFSWYQDIHYLVRGRRAVPHHCHSEVLGVWPAVLGFLVFGWLEIAFTGAAEPRVIGVLAIAYSVITFAGMSLFGKHTWLRNCEVFSVFFAFLSRTAITEIRVGSNCPCQACSNASCKLNSGNECSSCEECLALASPSQVEWSLRFPGAGLTAPEYVSTSQAAFVLLMLATVSFDGIQETTLWADLSIPLLTFTGNSSVVGGMGLVAFSLLIAGVYLFFERLIMLLDARYGYYPGNAARGFVYTLIPIAIGYHFAHYAPDFFTQGQFLIPLASDPLGLGWNLFGTRDFHPSTVLQEAKAVWISAISAIVLGHFVAVVASHVLANRVFPDHASALRSESVMVVLMVGYTMMSLWVVSQPMTLDSAAAP